MRIVHQAVLTVSVFAFSLGTLAQSAHAKDTKKQTAETEDVSKSDEEEAKHCDDYEGTFSSVAISPCVDSPVALCTQGELEGDLEGDYYFVFETLAPDPADPTQFLYTGYSVITTNKGTIYTEDTGHVDNAPPTDPAELVTTAQIAYGTKKYRKRSGTFVATGVLQFGAADGTYEATICKEKGKN